MWTDQEIQAECGRRMRIRYSLSTNEGQITIYGTGNIRELEADRKPVFVSRLEINAAGCYVQGELTDTMLGHLVDMIEKFLQRPERQINVRVEVVPPPPEAVERFSRTGEPSDDEVSVIRRRMLQGR